MINKIDQIDRIEGWFLIPAMHLFDSMNEVQKKLGVNGHIFEIGTYYGRSAAVLGQLLRPEEKFRCCDTFSGNLSNENRFENSLRKNYQDIVGKEVDQTFACKSEALQGQLQKEYRIWHIDGYHSYEVTLNDLKLGDQYTVDEGIIIVDDFLNQDWLGVCQGLNEFLNNGDWAVYAYGHNKTFLCRKAMYLKYYQASKEIGMPYSPHNFLPFHGFNWVSFN